MSEIITLAHGSGGKLTNELIKSVFLKHFSNDILLSGDDSARIDIPSGRAAFTTDSFVITPIVFKGGDIGKIAVCGTVNDITAAGARPLYLSCGFIIEEGLPINILEEIVASMGRTARECGVRIVAGDTKVVQKNAADKIFINTSGIGIIHDGVNVSGSYAAPGDKVIITGTIGDHGSAILLEREKLDMVSELESDCAPLNLLMEKVFENVRDIHVLRDPTRGGVAVTLNEIANQSNMGIKLYEEVLPIREQVRGICELLGLDPLYMANEGKMLIIVPENSAKRVLEVLKKEKYGQDSAIIGEVVEDYPKRVIMKTLAGGLRILDMPVGDQLPRIC
jgi:hydrogenase expression/formation protein HypE